tara:strand:- start:11783 stop:12172 length:390 start_codon:yes stop_codon:yes gene_type:complete
MNKTYAILGAILICLGIILGALGAHSLKDILTLDELSSFEVGVRYQMYHGIIMLVLGLNAKEISLNSYYLFGFTLGTILFSFSIYSLCADRAIGIDLSFLGPITPIGGGVLILTWVYLIIQIAKSKNKN